MVGKIPDAVSISEEVKESENNFEGQADRHLKDCALGAQIHYTVEKES